MDLTTTYLGLKLKNPLVASSSPMMQDVDAVRRLEDCGASAIIMHSLFEEQINVESTYLDTHLSQHEDHYAEAVSYFPEMGEYKLGPEAYLEHIQALKNAVDIPIMGSLNGISKGGWTACAKQMEEAGADALELNMYFIPTDPSVAGPEIEAMYVDLMRDVRAHVKIPIAVKLSPFFSAPINMCHQLEEAGADGVVLFNRFYQPDFDLEELEVVPNLVLSTAQELRLRLRWAAILFGQIKGSIGITGGVHHSFEALKCVMAGADVAMMTSALLRNGIDHLETMLEGMRIWMEEHEYESVAQMKGSMSQQKVAEPAAFERANYLKVLSSYAWHGPSVGT